MRMNKFSTREKIILALVKVVRELYSGLLQ